MHATPAGGEGRAYYDWRVHKMRTALAAAAAAVSATGRSLAGAPQQHQPQPQQRLGLSPEERAAILGEQMLPASSAAQQGGGAPAGAAQAAAAPPPQLLPAGVRAVDVASVAETDRQRLAASLEGAFVKGSQQDFTRESQQQQEAAAGLWRPAPKLTPAQEEQRAKLPPAARAFLSDMAGRFAGGSSQETAVLQPEASGLLRTPAAAGAEPAAPAPEAPESRLPTRSFEDWRPSPLLCKRFNVPDPYKGRKAPQQMSKYKTDYLALPDTAAAFAAGGIPKRLPGQAPAEAQLLLQLPPPPAGPVPVGAGGGLLGGLQLPPPPAGLAPSGAGGARPGGMQMQMPLPPPPPLPTAAAAASPAGDVAAMAADIMGELEAEFAVPASAAAAHQLPPLPPGPPPPDVDAEPVGEEAVAAAGEKPLDLFKAIFEASDSSDDDEEEEQEGDGQQLPPRAAAGGQPADAEAAAGQPAAQKQPAQPQGSQGAAGRVDAVDAVSKAKGELCAMRWACWGRRPAQRHVHARQQAVDRVRCCPC
jgi:G patch domain-containing protein 1